MKPPRLTLNESRARAVLARQGAGLAVDLGAPWVASLQPLPLAEAPADWAQAWTLQAEWGGARFALRVPEAALTLWAESETGLELNALPPELLALALEQAWRQVAAALVPLRRGPARLATVQPGTAFGGLPHRMAVALQRADGQAAFDAEIATDALGLLLVAGALAQRPAAATEPPAALPMPCHLMLGRSLVPQAQVRALRVGDVVLFHERWLAHDTDGTARLVLVTQGQVGWRIALADDRVHLIEPWSLPVTAPAAAEDSPVALDAVLVTLSFDLGTLTLPLSELRQLAAGQSFDLGRPLAGAVQVRANGALVGVGELVEIDGRLGVALTQLGGSPESA